ncbi:NAD(P)/FAD-dependent oxidoreductase [Acidocella sp. KAb 2-4]|uniref:NAD(P)/FAD-dependent oxidoreductase n=1 Tax=Acidocella sp. KAb 2-4 TaxID=2885158 RepID=UPI001D08A17E|nr:FAD-dependent oxidoreductase [Acidocella sp. KAb 2-4]MCB5945852.1 FAD-dependent oxidoreductase [Acidocella sp. KAb 2-4]
MSRPEIAVIGAGVAGLTAARRLAQTCAVTVFDKARGPGGRLANRQRAGFAFDFGAQFFTARAPRFMAEVGRLRAAGIVQPWHCRFAEIEDGRTQHRRDWADEQPHYVATGRMAALATHWAAGLDVRQNTRIAALERVGRGWALLDDAGRRFGPFAFVVLALPAPQAAALLPSDSPLRTRAASADMQGCYALMLGLTAPLDPGFDAAIIRGEVLSWLSLCQSRPGHEGGPGLVALSRNDWAEAHMDSPAETVRAAMQAELETILGHGLEPAHSDLHRWRYANCPPAPAAPPLADGGETLAVCGDWTHHGRVEAAYLSGLETAEAVLRLCPDLTSSPEAHPAAAPS